MNIEAKIRNEKNVPEAADPVHRYADVIVA